MTTALPPRLTLALPEEAVAGFASLLQHGILFNVDRPTPIVPFLLGLPGFTAEYVENTVQTIFINGVAADSLDRSLGGGSTLALSAAMPGLAGAIFRRQGVHGSLRSQPVAQAEPCSSDSGWITLKLFNSIAADRVRDLLTEGVQVSGRGLCEFARRRAELFATPTVLTLDDQPFAAAAMETLAAEPVVLIRAVLLPKN